VNGPGAWGLCSCPCLCWNGGSSPDGRCLDCQQGLHSHNRDGAR
jgi:hypothetical protein